MNIEERKKEILEIKNKTFNYILDRYQNRSFIKIKIIKNLWNKLLKRESYDYFFLFKYFNYLY